MRGAFLRFGADTPGPEFRGNSRERGRRSLTRHAQGSDPPLGAHTSPRRSGKADHGSRVCLAPRLCLGGAGGLTFGGAGGGDGRGGWLGGRGFFGRRTAGANGAKSRTRGRFQGSGLCARRASGRAAGAFSGPSRGFSGERRAKKNGRRRAKKRAAPGQNGAFGRPSGAGTAGVGGKKPLFTAKRAGNGAVLGRKLAESSAGRVGLFAPVQNLRAVSAEKLGASKKPFRAHIGRNCLSPLFFVDGAPSLGRIIWWFRRVAIWAEKSDECVTPRGKPTGSEKEATP